MIPGAARAASIAAGLAPRLVADGWRVVTSDLDGGDYPCDLSTHSGPSDLIDRVTADHGPLDGLVLSHAHEVQTGVLTTTAESFDQHMTVNARASLLLVAEFARPPGGVSADVIDPGSVDTGWMDQELRDALAPRHPLGRLGSPRDIAAVVSFLLSPEGRWISGQLLDADGVLRRLLSRAAAGTPSSTSRAPNRPKVQKPTIMVEDAPTTRTACMGIVMRPVHHPRPCHGTIDRRHGRSEMSAPPPRAESGRPAARWAVRARCV